MWLFPLCKRTKDYSYSDLVDKVLSELIEFTKETDLEKKAMEAIDILHSAETLTRQFFLRNPSLSFKTFKSCVIIKNRQRGYYRK